MQSEKKNDELGGPTPFPFKGIMNGGPVDVIAHSAGNVLIGAAIQDEGCTFRNYIALDAATALEAYGFDDTLVLDDDGKASVRDVENDLIPDAKQDEGLISIDGYKWKDYDARLYASEWYRLFPGSTDGRKNLTWRNRFCDVGTGNPVGYNFYSSTEEVLRNWNGDGLLHGPIWDWIVTLYNSVPVVPDGNTEAGEHFTKLYVYVKQEVCKGRKDTFLLPTIGGLPGSCAGWGFSTEGQFIQQILGLDIYPKSPSSILDRINGSESAVFWESLQSDPLFRKNPEILFDSYASYYLDRDCAMPSLELPSSTVTAGCRFDDWLLATSFPATTFAMGANENSSWPTRNFNMGTLMGPDWPRRCRNLSGGSYRNEWHHSDYKDVAYTYVYGLYEYWVELTGVTQ